MFRTNLVAFVVAFGVLLIGTQGRTEDEPAATEAQPAWVASVTKTLDLDAQQQLAFQKYVAALFVKPAAPAPLTQEQIAAMSLPSRLDYMADNIAADLTRERARAAAAHQFYAVLSPRQRTLFDAQTAPRHETGATLPATDDANLQANYSLPSHTNPDWVVKPTGDVIARVYPGIAQKKNLGGVAVIDCVADEQGYLVDCVVKSETPPGLGFGNAALEATAYMQMKPATQYGVPIRAEVTIPITFAPPK